MQKRTRDDEIIPCGSAEFSVIDPISTLRGFHVSVDDVTNMNINPTSRVPHSNYAYLNGWPQMLHITSGWPQILHMRKEINTQKKEVWCYFLVLFNVNVCILDLFIQERSQTENTCHRLNNFGVCESNSINNKRRYMYGVLLLSSMLFRSHVYIIA